MFGYVRGFFSADLAIDLGTNRVKLIQLKKRLNTNLVEASLFNSVEFTKNLENTYLKLSES